MKSKKSVGVEGPKQNQKERPASTQQKLEREKDKKEAWEHREEETSILLKAAKGKLPELKALLSNVSDHWHFEDPVL